MTKARRIIRDVSPKTIEAVPGGTMLVDGALDYIDADQSPVPADAKYVATMNEAGKIDVKTDTFDPPRQVPVLDDKGQPKLDAQGNPITEAAPNTSRHSFAGWPLPGVPIVKDEEPPGGVKPPPGVKK